MLLTITFILSILVVFNLLLLKFSVNKTKKPTSINKKPVVMHPNTSIVPGTEELALTGS